VVGGDVKQHANAVLAIMTYTTVPDVTTSNLSVNSGTTGNPGFGQTQFGGGFTISKFVPLYLEGTLAYSRYDPIFIATDGAEQRAVPTKWNTFSGTVGVGWDFRITDELVFRPILNGTIGRVSSDLTRTGSRSRTSAWSRSTRTASLSAGRTTAWMDAHATRP
jgi:hypothetical protein